MVWLDNYVPLGLGEIKPILGFPYPFLQKEVTEGPWQCPVALPAVPPTPHLSVVSSSSYQLPRFPFFFIFSVLFYLPISFSSGVYRHVLMPLPVLLIPLDSLYLFILLFTKTSLEHTRHFEYSCIITGSSPYSLVEREQQ